MSNSKDRTKTVRTVDNSGIMMYHSNGLLHNEEGAALEYPDGELKYFLHGIEYSEAEYDMIQLLKRPGCAYD